MEDFILTEKNIQELFNNFNQNEVFTKIIVHYLINNEQYDNIFINKIVGYILDSYLLNVIEIVYEKKINLVPYINNPIYYNKIINFIQTTIRENSLVFIKYLYEYKFDFNLLFKFEKFSILEWLLYNFSNRKKILKYLIENDICLNFYNRTPNIVGIYSYNDIKLIRLFINKTKNLNHASSLIGLYFPLRTKFQNKLKSYEKKEIIKLIMKFNENIDYDNLFKIIFNLELRNKNIFYLMLKLKNFSTKMSQLKGVNLNSNKFLCTKKYIKNY